VVDVGDNGNVSEFWVHHKNPKLAGFGAGARFVWD
jgi:hypothetical protein